MDEHEYTTWEQKDTWEITDDGAAEWAIKRIREVQEDYERQIKLAKDEIEKYKAFMEKAEKKMDNETAFFKGRLMQYMQQVKCKETKTQKTYQLCSGKLVHKTGGFEYNRDDTELVNWLHSVGKEKYIKTKESPDWAEFKKKCSIAEDGSLVDDSTGEIVQGVKAERKPDSFEVVFSDD